MKNKFEQNRSADLVDVPPFPSRPVSRAKSNHLVHRSRFKKKNELCDPIWTKMSIANAEQLAIAPIYSLLERAVEHLGTMQACDTRVLVKDVVRKAARFVKKEEGVKWL